MKRNKILFPVAALAVLCAACDDDKMDWGTPEGETPISGTSQIPLNIQEQINNYDYIKNYVEKYRSRVGSQFILGLGLGADMYLSDTTVKRVADENFQMYTTGNAMKQGVMVKINGDINFSTVDKFLAAVPADSKIYGHNFIWHTQQNQDYLKSLIAPEKVIEADGDIANMLPGDASDFNGGKTGEWDSWGSKMQSVEAADGGVDDTKCLKLVSKGGGNFYDAQCAYTFGEPLKKDVNYVIKFQARVESGSGELQFQYQNGTTYKSQGGYNSFTVGSDWTTCQYEFTITDYDDVNRILINFGKIGGTYYVDNIEFGEAKQDPMTNVLAGDNSDFEGGKTDNWGCYVDDIKWGLKNGENKSLKTGKATKIYYVLKTPEEKYEALDNAMEQWIKGMFEHIKGDNRFVAWDVINEAISDDGGRRGINGVFGGSWTKDDVTYYDQEPEETESEGLKLNWSPAGNQHFYWGYYMGMDYAVKAYQYARKYADENGFSDLKLFYNDYNLETSPSKLNEVIEFIKDIDAANGKPIVDGIGTQMHVQSSISREEIDAMFKALAATGKLIRVTELDVATGSATPSSAQLEQQAKTYQNIVESYIENVPEAQRHGITIWSLSDAAEEHEYWLNGDAPNLFDANLARKWAYKGVCDAIAGEDIGAKLKGDDWTEKKYQDRKDTEAEDEE